MLGLAINTAAEVGQWDPENAEGRERCRRRTFLGGVSEASEPVATAPAMPLQRYELAHGLCARSNVELTGRQWRSALAARRMIGEDASRPGCCAVGSPVERRVRRHHSASTLPERKTCPLVSSTRHTSPSVYSVLPTSG